MTFSINDTQNNHTLYRVLSAECRDINIFMLSVIMVSVIMLNVVMFNVVAPRSFNILIIKQTLIVVHLTLQFVNSS